MEAIPSFSALQSTSAFAIEEHGLEEYDKEKSIALLARLPGSIRTKNTEGIMYYDVDRFTEKNILQPGLSQRSNTTKRSLNFVDRYGRAAGVAAYRVSALNCGSVHSSDEFDDNISKLVFYGDLNSNSSLDILFSVLYNNLEVSLSGWRKLARALRRWVQNR